MGKMILAAILMCATLVVISGCSSNPPSHRHESSINLHGTSD